MNIVRGLQMNWPELSFNACQVTTSRKLLWILSHGHLVSLYYMTLKVAGIPIDAMVNPESSTTVMSFELFKNVEWEAGIPLGVFRPPDLVFQDDSPANHPYWSPSGSDFEWQGKSVVSTVYLCSELGAEGAMSVRCQCDDTPGFMILAPGVEPHGGDSLPRKPTV